MGRSRFGFDGPFFFSSLLVMFLGHFLSKKLKILGIVSKDSSRGHLRRSRPSRPRGRATLSWSLNGVPPCYLSGR